MEVLAVLHKFSPLSYYGRNAILIILPLFFLQLEIGCRLLSMQVNFLSYKKQQPLIVIIS